MLATKATAYKQTAPSEIISACIFFLWLVATRKYIMPSAIETVFAKKTPSFHQKNKEIIKHINSKI